MFHFHLRCTFTFKGTSDEIHDCDYNLFIEVWGVYKQDIFAQAQYFFNQLIFMVLLNY